MATRRRFSLAVDSYVEARLHRGSAPQHDYYKSGDKTGKEREDADLRDRIERLALRFPRYGFRRMTAQLKRDGLKVNHKRVLRIMRASDLLCRVKRKFVRTTNSNHDYRMYPNLYQNRVPDGPNQVWVADITYIRLLTDFVYRSAELTTKSGCDPGCLFEEGGGLVLITPDQCSVDRVCGQMAIASKRPLQAVSRP